MYSFHSESYFFFYFLERNLCLKRRSVATAFVNIERERGKREIREREERRENAAYQRSGLVGMKTYQELSAAAD